MFINKVYPWLHATPAFLSSCDCHGEGCGEIKCPYCIEDCSFEQYVKKPSSCLEKKGNCFHLKENHLYYYQVQQQIFTTKRSYCDFVVYALNQNGSCFVHDRIYPNQGHWDIVVPKISKFWPVGILPEILGRWYTRVIRRTNSDLLLDTEENGPCYCRERTDEITIKCLNPLCEIHEVHPSCFDIMTVPKAWYCPNCQKLPQFKPNKIKANKDDEMMNRALAYDAICIYQKKTLEIDKLIECHNNKCEHGMFSICHALITSVRQTTTKQLGCVSVA